MPLVQPRVREFAGREFSIDPARSVSGAINSLLIQNHEAPTQVIRVLNKESHAILPTQGALRTPPPNRRPNSGQPIHPIQQNIFTQRSELWVIESVSCPKRGH